MAELEDILNDDAGMDMGMGDEAEEAVPGGQRNPAWARLLEAWEGEKAAPDLLKWRGDLVEGLVEAMEQQERSALRV